MSSTDALDPTETIYLVAAQDYTPMWEANADSAAGAVAEHLAFIDPREELLDEPFLVFEITAEELARFERSTQGMRKAIRVARRRKYHHQEALSMLSEIDGSAADRRVMELSDQLQDLAEDLPAEGAETTGA